MLFVDPRALWQPAPRGGALFRKDYCDGASRSNRVEILQGDGDADLFCVQKKMRGTPAVTTSPYAFAPTFAPVRPAATAEPEEIATALPTDMEEVEVVGGEEFATAKPDG